MKAGDLCVLETALRWHVGGLERAVTGGRHTAKGQ